MTKEQANQKAKQGFKVRHESWQPHCFVKKDGNHLIDETNTIWRKFLYFDTNPHMIGWEVVEEDQLTIKEDVLNQILYQIDELAEQYGGIFYGIPWGDEKASKEMREIIANNLNAKIDK